MRLNKEKNFPLHSAVSNFSAKLIYFFGMEQKQTTKPVVTPPTNNLCWMLMRKPQSAIPIHFAPSKPIAWVRPTAMLFLPLTLGEMSEGRQRPCAVLSFTKNNFYHENTHA